MLYGVQQSHRHPESERGRNRQLELQLFIMLCVAAPRLRRRCIRAGTFTATRELGVMPEYGFPLAQEHVQISSCRDFVCYAVAGVAIYTTHVQQKIVDSSVFHLAH